MNTNRTKYDAIIIGFGKGGKTLAAALGDAGRQVALIEKSREMYGGTCINAGCIPTKSLVNSARTAMRLTGGFAEKADFYREAIEKKDRLITMLRGKNYQKLDKNPNVMVIDAAARFLSPTAVEVDDGQGRMTLEAEQIFINTGSVPVTPSIKGIENNPFVYFSEELLHKKELPKHMVIIGGGYIGVEFASIYADFGTKVTILQDGGTFLVREDAEIADAVRENLLKRGVEVLTGVKTEAVKALKTEAHVIIEREDGTKELLEADTVLVATGRRPATDALNLAAAGVEVTKRGGIVTNDSLQTSAPNIYAMGDVRGSLQFTYISLDDYRIVRSAVLGDGSYTLKERGAVPYSVFLNPPFSRVGLSEQEAVREGYEVKVLRLAAAAIPKAQVLEQTEGLLKAVIDTKTGLILGAHLFCEESHEMIQLIKLAMDAKLPYTVLGNMIYTHPTMSEALNDLFS